MSLISSITLLDRLRMRGRWKFLILSRMITKMASWAELSEDSEFLFIFLDNFQACSKNLHSQLSFQNTARSTSTSAGRWCRKPSSLISSKPSWIWFEERCRWRQQEKLGIHTSSSKREMSSSCFHEVFHTNKRFVCSTMRSHVTSSRSRIWWGIVRSSWSDEIGSLDLADAHSSQSSCLQIAMCWCKVSQWVPSAPTKAWHTCERSSRTH